MVWAAFGGRRACPHRRLVSLPAALLSAAALASCGTPPASDAGHRDLATPSRDAERVADGSELGGPEVDEGPGDAGRDGGPACGATPCDDDCVELALDPRHCGGCGQPCAAFEACRDAACRCPDGDPWCGGGGYAAWPMPDPEAPALRRRGEQVLDDVTGLSWQARTDGRTRTWADAIAYCAGLVLGGSDDWRLPTRVELTTILDPTRTPSLADAFPEPVPDYHWTASRPAFSDRLAFSVYFGQGETVTADAGRAGAHVRCVRGGQPRARGWRIEGALAIDPATGLHWVREPGPASTLDEATGACAGLELEGRDDYRLPSLNELATTVDEARRSPALDPAIWGPGPGGELWSAAARDFGERLHWVLDVDDGTSVLREVSAPRRYRCVARPSTTE